MGKVLRGWAELHASASLKEAALVSIGWKVYQVEFQMFLMTRICADLAQKNCFLSFAASCTANHSTEKEFFSLLFQKALDNLLLFHSLWSHISAKKKDSKRRMRQLRGKPKKETSKDKKERKQAMQEARQQITTVVLPTLAVVVLLIVVFVYVATRPNTTEWCSFSDSLALGY